MKVSLKSLIAISVIGLAAFGCKKSSYTSADNTVGLVSGSRAWYGYSSGYAEGDTLLPGDTAHHAWAKYYYHVISDSVFAIQKINGFLIDAMGIPMNYLSTDSLTGIEKFDTTVAGSGTSFLNYYFVKDSANIEYHHVGAYNSASGHYFESNIYVHTH